MPIADTSSTFLNGLSDLWTRFFKDKNQLAALYKGTESLVGQAYLDLLDTVLNLSMRNTPVWNKEYYKLITVREDLCVYDITVDRWVFELPDGIQDFKLLCNKVLNPSALLQVDVDFEINLTRDVDELRFKVNPFTVGTGGGVSDGFAWRTVQVDSIDYKEIAFWVPDAQIDKGALYLNYGSLLSYYAPSSAAYKALLNGIMQYFILGPTLNQVTSTLNVCAGLPVIREDGEVLESIDYTDATVNTITTDLNTYVFPKNVPLRADVEDTANWGVLAFVAYEQLSDLFTVEDHISNPTWWYDIVVPARLTRDPTTGAPEPRNRRTVDPNLYPAVIGDGMRKIGDPGFYVGADEDGSIPVGGRPGLSHYFGYVVMQRYLKSHMFAITYDPAVLQSIDLPFPIWDSNFQSIIVAGKPAYVMLYADPNLTFYDVVAPPTESLTLTAGVIKLDTVDREPNDLLVGGAWNVGDYYTYDPAGGIIITNESVLPPVPANGDTSIVVGGADPYIMPPEISLVPNSSKMMDWPVQLTVTVVLP